MNLYIIKDRLSLFSKGIGVSEAIMGCDELILEDVKTKECIKCTRLEVLNKYKKNKGKVVGFYIEETLTQTITYKELQDCSCYCYGVADNKYCLEYVEKGNIRHILGVFTREELEYLAEYLPQEMYCNKVYHDVVEALGGSAESINVSSCLNNYAEVDIIIKKGKEKLGLWGIEILRANYIVDNFIIHYISDEINRYTVLIRDYKKMTLNKFTLLI